ncbi:hypothetical protein JOM56_007750, partial [Amanita muscaria]
IRMLFGSWTLCYIPIAYCLTSHSILSILGVATRISLGENSYNIFIIPCLVGLAVLRMLPTGTVFVV